MVGDEVLERDEPRVVHVGEPVPTRRRVDLEQPRQQRRHLDAGEVLLARLGVDEDDGEVEREPGDVGERVRGVDRQRGEDGEDLVGEQPAQLRALVLGQLVPAEDVDALLLEGRLDLVSVDLGLHVEQLVGDERDLLEDLARLEARRGAHGDARGDPSLEPGDADHEELVEVRGEDREVAAPLEEGDRLVGGELEHPLVELQPRDLAVEEAVGRHPVLLDGRGPDDADEPPVGRPCGGRAVGGEGRGRRRHLADEPGLGGRLRGVGGGTRGRSCWGLSRRRLGARLVRCRHGDILAGPPGSGDGSVRVLTGRRRRRT